MIDVLLTFGFSTALVCCGVAAIVWASRGQRHTRPLASPPTSQVRGLTPDEVEQVARTSLPEISPDTLRSLVLLLRGIVDEKTG